MRVSTALVSCVFAILAVPARAGDVQLTMRDGLVTLIATNATIGEILDTWAQVGQATIVNADQLTGSPVTLQLADVPEGEALEIILRSVSGYLAAPRRTPEPNLSRFDRIHVLPSTSAPTTSAAPPPAFQQRQIPPEFNPQDQLTNRPPNPAEFEQGIPGDDPSAAPARRGPLFGSSPPPVRVPPRSGSATRPTAPYTQPDFPAGVAVPGMVLPAPEDQPGAPGTRGPVLPPPNPR